MKSLKIVMLLLAVTSAFELFAQSQNQNWPLIASYPLNGDAKDISGNENHGIVGGNTQLTTDRFGRADHAYLFDGETSYIQVNPVTVSDSLTDFSFSFWYKLNGFIEGKAIYTVRNNSDIQYLLDFHAPYEIETSNLTADGPVFVMEYKTDQKSYFHYTVCKDSINPLYAYPVYETFETKIDTNSWYHVVFQRKGDFIYTYINGELLTRAQINRSNLSLNFNHPWYFGNSGAGLYSGYRPDFNYTFNGVLDDINIYEKALNEREIKELYYDEKCLDIVFDTVEVVKTINVYDTIVVNVIDTALVTFDTIRTEVFDTVHVTVYDTVSVSDTLFIEFTVNSINQHKAVLKVYPNPTNDLLIIESDAFADLSDKSIWIADIAGRVIHSEQMSQILTKINLRGIAKSGTYVLMVVDENFNILQKRKIVLR